MKKEIYYINHNYLFIINVKLSQPRTHKQWLPSFIYIWTYSLLCKNYRKMDLKQGSQPAGSDLCGGQMALSQGLHARHLPVDQTFTLRFLDVAKVEL